MRTRAPATLIVLCLLALLGACGGEEPETSERVPAAGENTPPAGTPGVPADAPYDVDGGGWERLGKSGQFAAAEAFIADNPARCEGAAASAVAIYTTNSYGFDYPTYAPAAELLAEACDADRQS